VSAGAQTPSPCSSTKAKPAPLPPVLHEVVDPADPAQVEWLVDLFRRGKADLYAQDEADLALLPTLTSTWMLRGQQLKVRAPGTNQKGSVSAACDLADGTTLWVNGPKRSAPQFVATMHQCVQRSLPRGRLAVLLVDNAASHRVGKTGWVRDLLDFHAGRLVLVFQPPYSPELQPVEKLWRQWRPNVTHNHTCAGMDELWAKSTAWLRKMAERPAAVRVAIGFSDDCSPIKLAA
jgi:hypothetical protein